MRKICEVLRLHHEFHFSSRQIAESVHLNHKTVLAILYKAQAAKVEWPIPAGISDEELERRLYPPPAQPHSRPLPDYAWVDRELRRRGVTRKLLWLEYKSEHPEGLGYTEFCKGYQDYLRDANVTMRQLHRAGEKLFIDYCGLTIPYGPKGAKKQAQIFVACLGASSYLYCEATATQGTEDFLASHIRTFAFFGGLVRILVPDNLKAAVLHADRYDPELNPRYQELAEYYGMAILPARPRRPRDKACVEAAVKEVERWVLAPLRDRDFSTLEEIHRAMAPLREELNLRPFQKREGSRRSVYEALEKPALRPLPPEPFPLAVWRHATVGPDYHVLFDGRLYSVPYRLVGAKVEVRATADVVEILYQHERVASHARRGEGRFSTQRQHMPASHQAQTEPAEWTPERLVRWAGKIGPQSAALVKTVLDQASIPAQAFRSCLGIIRQLRCLPHEEAEKAAERALAEGRLGARALGQLLRSNRAPDMPHANVRGADYYRRQAAANREGA